MQIDSLFCLRRQNWTRKIKEQINKTKHITHPQLFFLGEQYVWLILFFQTLSFTKGKHSLKGLHCNCLITLWMSHVKTLSDGGLSGSITLHLLPCMCQDIHELPWVWDITPCVYKERRVMTEGLERDLYHCTFKIQKWQHWGVIIASEMSWDIK